MFRGGLTPKPKRSQPKRSLEAKKLDSPLEELQQCLDRFEELLDNTRRSLYSENEEEIETTPPEKSRSFFRSRRKDEKGKSKDEKLDSSKSIGSSTQNSFFGNPKSKFVPMSATDEEEMIEVLRRIAELVVMGEKAAAATQKKADKRRLSNAKSDYGEEEEERAKIDAHIALFENFFERNVLDLIVKMVTGIAFEEGFSPPQSRATDAETEEKEEDEEVSEKMESSTAESSEGTENSIKDDITFLPPIQIATQAIQSVSILIQNVSRATSLYFLLSNNYVNDLINLPLKLYSNAERFQRGESTVDLSQLRAGSPEIAELTTHYVTFLKSLALRMNAETLQFFLTYPNERSDETASSMNFSSFEEDESVTQKSNSKSSISKPIQINTVEVEFPLYARALEYCAAHQDSFIRVTAMNICLNTLRLATVSTVESPDTNFEGNSSSPDGVLHATALPLRERLAIAQHVCSPRLVEGLVSPIFTKLAQLWGTMEELIRDIDMLREGILQTAGGTRIRDSKMEQAKADTKRTRLTNSLKDTVADFQDELELFEDVLKVGLTSLNEQSIEMMLATFVYPLLLQPLLLYFSSLNRSQVPIMVDVLSLGAQTNTKEAGVDSFGAGKIQDSAPAKTALFSLTAVFQLLSNPPLMRLLLTALFHPLAPDSSGETMIRAKPDVAGVGPDGKLCIRIDSFSSAETKLEFEPSPYSFGNITGEKSVRGESHNATDKVDESCVYVLSPALTEVLEGQAGDLSLIARTRSNPYRRAVLKCLTAGPSMFGLRQIAVLLMDAVVKRFGSKFASDVLFGAGMKAVSDETPLDERTLDSKRAYSKNNRDMGQKIESGSRQSLTGGSGSSFMGEVVSALSLSTINVSMFYEGLWKLVFDGIASHALLCLAKESDKAIELATKLIEQRRRMAAGFISELPFKIDEICGKQVDDDDEGVHEDSEARTGMHAHNIFFISAKGKQFSVVGELLRLKESVGKTENDEYSVSIAMSSKYDDTSSRIGNFGKLHLDSDVRHATLQISATSAMALAQIDALSTFLKDLAATDSAVLKGNPPNSFAISRMGTIISTTQFYVADVNRSIFSPISTRFAKNLLRLDEEISKEVPQPGSVVGLVGRTAIPCVCEVPASCFALLTDETSSVVSDGVKWLSLYVVFYSGYMILAEPERKGSGGNGRVVSACYLTSLSVERDDSPSAGNASPARRLLVVHRSLDDKPPGLFLPEKTSPVSCGPFNRLEQSKSTLDVWFEDENSAEHAYRVMSMKLGRAMSKRGNRLREKLATDS